MNVVIFASAFHPHTGGVEELCRQLAHEYQRRGMGVIVLTNRWPRSLAEFEEVEGIPVHRLAMRVAGESVKSKVTAMLTGWAVRRQMLGILRRFRPDVLHVQCVSVNAAYALVAKRRLGVPLVVTLQGELTMDATQLFQRSAWAKRILRQSLDDADAITACSLQTLTEAQTWYGKPFGERGRVVYNGISLDDAAGAVPWPHRRPYVLAIGRHVPQKGFDVLLRAMGRLVAGGEMSHDLILAGDGTEHERLKGLAGELGIGERVVFAGRVDHAKASRLFAGCAFFVLPSRHEPFGIVNLEAMAASKAVLAFRVGGVPELVLDAETGMLVNAEQVGELAAAARRLMSDDDMRARLGAAGRRRAEGFGWPAIAEQYLEVYSQVPES